MWLAVADVVERLVVRAGGLAQPKATAQVVIDGAESDGLLGGSTRSTRTGVRVRHSRRQKDVRSSKACVQLGEKAGQREHQH